MSVYTEYCKQGNRGNCMVVALKNIYKHFGVEINFTDRESLRWGYKPIKGANAHLLLSAGVVLREIPLSTLNRKNLGRTIKNGLKERKIYAVIVSGKNGGGDRHIYLIVETEDDRSFETHKTICDNFTFSQKISVANMFRAINRRRNIFFDNFDAGRYSVTCYKDKDREHDSLIDETALCADLGIRFYKWVKRGQKWEVEVQSDKVGALLEISGIQESFAKAKVPVYKFNFSLRRLLKRYIELKELINSHKKYFYEVMSASARVMDKKYLPMVIEENRLPAVIEKSPL